MILLLLSLTATKNATGVEALFGNNFSLFFIPSSIILMFSILSPILKNTLCYMKTIDRTLTLGCKLTLAGFVFSCFLGKMVSIVAAFTPPLGLFSILGHLQEQRKPFSCAVMLPPSGDGFYHGVNRRGELTKTSWTSIGGVVCQNGSRLVDVLNTTQDDQDWKPDPASYIPFDLPFTCLLVAFLGIIRLLAVYAAKYLLSEDFGAETSFCQQICRIIHNNIGATPLTSEWENATTLPEIGRKFFSQKLEMVALLMRKPSFTPSHHFDIYQNISAPSPTGRLNWCYKY